MLIYVCAVQIDSSHHYYVYTVALLHIEFKLGDYHVGLQCIVVVADSSFDGITCRSEQGCSEVDRTFELTTPGIKVHYTTRIYQLHVRTCTCTLGWLPKK